MFDRVVCISLDKRQDRWKEFVGRLPEDLPFGPIEKCVAIDGKKCPGPSWWKQGNPAWGCYRSHTRLIEECLNQDVNSILLLEDDAIFCDGFAEKFKTFIEHVPNDWGMLYLGGQHFFMRAHPPKRVNEWVYRPYNVNRTHAFALRGATMRDVYVHLHESRKWANRHHIDHHLGRLLMEGRHPVYCPKEWLVGQSENRSNIAGRDFPERFWPPAKKEKVLPTPFVVVVGLHRSGSSLLAGMLHTVGVHMGNKFIGCEFNGGYEAKTFARLCEQMMPFPGTEFKLGVDEFKNRFQRWATARSKEAKKKGQIAGCKYPHSCAVAPMLRDALGSQMKVVHINRPLEKSIASLIRRDGKRQDTQLLEQVQRFLWEKKQEFLGTQEHITVQYEDLLDSPEKELKQAIDFLGIHPSDKLIFKACRLVNRSKQHIT